MNINDDFSGSGDTRVLEKPRGFIESKIEINRKLTSDSEDFRYVLEENTEKEENTRKDKLNNVLQAFFKFNIEKLRNK